MDNYKRTFLLKTIQAATDAGHIWPAMAASEAALESGFGTSGLAIRDNNLFGMKQHKHPVYGTETLPTKEFINSNWVTVSAQWVKYPTLRDCFTDRMATLVRLESVYSNYHNAIAARDAVSYIMSVSLTWSTDPNRANKVQAIYQEYLHG